MFGRVVQGMDVADAISLLPTRERQGMHMVSGPGAFLFLFTTHLRLCPSPGPSSPAFLVLAFKPACQRIY